MNRCCGMLYEIEKRNFRLFNVQKRSVAISIRVED